MRNRISRFIFGLIIMVSVNTSCKKDFLERAPSDLIDEQKAFSNLNNAEAYLNNAYAGLPGLLEQGVWNLGSATDEGCHMWGSDKSSIDINNGNISAVSFPMDWRWSQSYAQIRITNMFLKNYDLIPEEVGNQSSINRKKRLLGEAHALRAFFYFQLFKAWGEVPLIKEALMPGGNTAYKIPKSSTQEVVQFIESDLQIAIENLPATHVVSEFGRFTSTSAYALLSRLHLYNASALFNADADKERWKVAESESKKALQYAKANGYGLSLATNSNGKRAYERIFLESNNIENILSSAGGFGPGNWDFWAGPLADNSWYGEGPLQEMVDSYEMKNGELPVLGYDNNGKQIINPNAGYNPQKPYENRDDRFYQSIIYNGAVWKNRVVNIAPGGTDFAVDRPRINYYWRKYIVEDHNLFTGAGDVFRRFILFRYAELLLNYAEARNELLEAPDTEIYQSINEIRSRAGLPDLPIGLSKDKMRERIRNERKVELVLEHHRFWDVRRWKIAEKVDNTVVRGVQVSQSGEYSYPIWQMRVFDKSKHYLLPVPQSEIDKNPDILKQTIGWD